MGRLYRPPSPYLLGTVLGMLPRTAIPVWLAHRAASTGAHDLQAFLQEGPGWTVAAIGVVAMLLLLALMGTLANRALERVTA